MVEFDDGLAVAIRGAVQARREDAVSLLQELVRVPSVTGEEGAAVGSVVGRAFSERGLEVDTWEATREETEPYRDHVGEQSSYENRPNVAGTRRGTGEGRSVLLNAHTDTVDPGDPTAWKGDPLSGNDHSGASAPLRAGRAV
jgi:acetylornithine deacetylase